MTDPGLDTTVHGDPDSVRAAATGVGALGGALSDAGDAFGGAVGQSGGLWTGPAGDAFRGRISGAQQDTATAAGATQQLETAMHTFAGQLAAVKAQIGRAETVASAAGLSVSGSTITPPVPPQSPPTGYFDAGQTATILATFHAETAKYAKQHAAYTEAEAMIQQARQQETQAHSALTAAVGQVEDVLGGLLDSPAWLAGSTVLDAADRSLDQAAKWQGKADDLDQQLRTMVQDAVAKPPDPEVFQDELKAMAEAAGDADHAENAALSNRFGLSEDVAGDAGRWVKGVGYVTSGLDFVADAMDPHDRAAHLAGDATETAVNEVGSEVIEDLAIDGAPETFGASLVVGGVAYGAGMLVENEGPQAWHWIDHFPSELGTAANDLLP
jgi:hypothetical protein